MADNKNTDSNLIPIKPQYVFNEPDEGEAPDKKIKLEEHGRTQRPLVFFEHLCRVLVDVPPEDPMPVCSTMRCRYLHDVVKYLQTKPPDIGPECYVYKLKGHCPRGITCRFGKQHITESGRNKTDEARKKDFEANGVKTLNFYSRDTEGELRRRTYNFRLSEEVLNEFPKPPNPAWISTGNIDFTEDVDVTAEVPIPVPVPEVKIPEDRLGPCPDDEKFKEHMTRKKKLVWSDKTYVPAISNFGNLPFRRICKEFGANITCSEPLVASNILEGTAFDWLLTKRHESEDIFGVQLFGNNPFILTRAAQLLEEKTNADFIDFRYGFPGEPLRFQKKCSMAPSLLRCVANVTSLPVSVSCRLTDIDELTDTYKSCDVSLLSISGRSKESREVDWKGIVAASEKVSPIPVMGCSDVFTYNEYQKLRTTYPQLAGLVINRGALVKPWLFTELEQKRDWDISSSERFDIIKKYINYGLDHWGSDSKGVEATRRFFLDWMSFLCRYIPIGLMEQPPQKLNDRCPKFFGRDTLETLMGSHEPSDWIKISEMVLGAAPEGFQFNPKIRQGYWPLDT